MVDKFKYPTLLEIEFLLKLLKRKILFDWQSDEKYINRLFYQRQGYKLNLKNPKTLNEKIQWLKINERKEYHTICADKFRVREYLSKYFSDEYFIPILFQSYNCRDIVPENLPNEPFIIKTNHDAGHSLIVRDKSVVDWGKVRLDFKFRLKNNYYYNEREWQYKNIVPCIIAEKLLVTSSGKIPNDYKVHCLNGKVEFIYVVVEREGANKRNIYNRDWQPLNFTWAPKNKDVTNIRGVELPAPSTLSLFIEFAERIAIDFPHYVRVDFYDVDGKLYFGEITQHHGGGFDQIRPFEFDVFFGNLINLKVK